LKVTTETAGTREVRLEIQLDQEELERAMQEAARRIARQVQIPGFRKGKAPYAVVLRMVGKEAVREEALESLVPRLYKQALEETQIAPYDQGVLEEVSDTDPPRLRIRVPLNPVVELGDYRSLRVEWQEPSVSEEEVQKALEDIARKHTAWEPKDGPVAEGDMVRIDTQGRTEDGEKVFESKGHNLVVRLESLYPVPGFHQELLGLRAGETKEFTLPFPEESSNKKLAGKPVRFQVKVHEVMQRGTPPLDDNLAKLVEGNYETLEDLRKAIRERLLQQRQEEAEEEYERKVLAALREISRVEFPAVALDQELDRILEAQAAHLEERGLDMETYLTMLKTTPEAYREGLKPAAEEQLVNRLLLAKVAEAEGFEPSEEETVDVLREWILGGEGEETNRDARVVLENEGFRGVVRDTLRRAEALRRLIRLARGEPPEEPAAPKEEPLPEATQASEEPAPSEA
jgi:trigger factor